MPRASARVLSYGSARLPVMTRALVLAGGGVAGIAWELGVLEGLARNGIDVTDADLVIGTSAGSVVGAQLLSGTPLPDLVERQINPPPGSDREIAVSFDLAALMEGMAAAARDATSPQDYRARIGAMALAATPSASPEARLEAVRARLPVEHWPATRFLVTAVDAENGEFVAFDRDSGVELAAAVAASCAVPGVWPPVPIDGRRYVDGGMRTLANADLAADCDAVLVIAPFDPPGGGLAPVPSEEVAQLQGRTRALLVDGGDAFAQATGANPLDPATRAPSARAGQEMGAAVAAQVADLWKG